MSYNHISDNYQDTNMFLNFENPVALKEQIEAVQPTKGVCIFIDICGSTAIKKEGLKRWLILIGNTLRICANVSPLFKDNIVKLIGDEIMIFIPEDRIVDVNENYATILDFLKTCISSNGEIIDNLTLRTKAVIHYCSNTYNITYAENAEDYYGLDIDLTARLMKKSDESQIVISEVFYQLVKDFDATFLENISEMEEGEFKGIDGKVAYRIMKVK